MYYILYEGLKIESNEPVYCTVNIDQFTFHYTGCRPIIIKTKENNILVEYTQIHTWKHIYTIYSMYT